ncbi:MAG: ATP-binding cassette domain-containing protein [Candidatus Diapherotrites archaeon]|nr:ATP-binding cassette domain-containing protein [Candidatus Diapherotrites archaeon]
MSEPIITVSGLSKDFEFSERKPGLAGALKALVSSEKKKIHAVNKVSFEVEGGEMLAFIGPNGAGKSTTIKMLTGILTPSGGSASVAGFDPWKQRQKLAFKIGTVFGQKSQLWMHLPAMDSFELMGKIYELPKAQFEKRRDELIERMEAKEFVNQPVRKLSLGQRMKCELIASLLHNPEILFLDEPTIGLDLIAKRKFREEIKRLNREEGTTIFLTSHDVSDIESLCKRIMIINHGKTIYDNSVTELKRNYLNKKVVSVLFEDKVQDFKIKNCKVLRKSKDDLGFKLEVDCKKKPIKEFLKEVAKLEGIEDITISDPPVEEIIEEIYKRK